MRMRKVRKMRTMRTGWHYHGSITGSTWHSFPFSDSILIHLAEFLSQGQMPGKGKGWCKQPWLLVSTGFVDGRLHVFCSFALCFADLPPFLQHIGTSLWHWKRVDVLVFSLSCIIDDQTIRYIVLIGFTGSIGPHVRAVP